MNTVHCRPHARDKAVKSSAILIPGDVCVNSTGTGTIGRVGLWQPPDDATYFADTHVTIVRPSQIVEPKYIAEALSSAEMQKRLETECFTGSTNQVELSKTALSLLRVLLPPLLEQRKIAAILSSVDEAIEKTQAVIGQVQVVKKGLMQELLTRGLPGRHSKFKQTEVGEIPEEWKVVTVGDVCDKPSYGANVKKAAWRPDWPRYVRITDIDDAGQLRASDPAGISPEDAYGYILEPGDLLVARSGATVGKTCMHRVEFGLCAHAGYLIKFVPNTSFIDPEFMFESMRSSRYWAWVRDSQRAQAQPNINAKEYSSYLIALPPMDEQREIRRVALTLQSREQCEGASLAALQTLKQSLMSTLLTGELRVTP